MIPEYTLDADNPRGWGKSEVEPEWPHDHGHIITDDDIGDIVNEYPDVQQIFVPGCLREHRFLSRYNSNNKTTVIFIPGGVGRLHAIDTKQMPKGLVFPLNLLVHWPSDINLLVVDMDHGLDWLFARKTDDMHFKNNNAWDKIKYIIEKSRGSDNLVSRFSTACHDISTIIDYIKQQGQDVWLAGHCGSCELLARYHDFVGEKPSISGFLFSNPAWKNTWREHLENLRYFRTDFNFPLMIAQHRDDRALVTDVEIAKKILETSCPPRAKYTELSGGIDQGLPHFSMGHHGFRGIESLLTDAMRDFVNSNTEVLDTNGLPK